MLQEKIFNAATGETTFVPLSEELQKEFEENAIEVAKRVAEIEANEAKRQTALDKLAALGLTSDDLSALGF